MKLTKYILSGTASLLLAAAAQAADINIYITGSTAFRSAAYAGIKALYDANVHVNAGSVAGVTVANPQAPLAPTSNATFNGQNLMAFSGLMPSLFGSTVVNVRCNWSGSVEGIRDVVQGNSLSFLSTADSQTSSFTDSLVTGVADFAFSDAYQSTTIYKTPTMATSLLGIIPFQFVKNNGAPSNLTNITHQHAQTLFANGVVPLSFLTGDMSNNGDTNKVACLIGRYAGSGTRFIFLADTGYGALKNTVNYKYSATAGPGGTAAFTQVTPDANVGYASGSSIRTDLGFAISQALGTDGATYVTGYAIGTLGVNDAAAVTGNGSGALSLTYNGVAYSPAAVKNGQYTLWSYQHLYNKTPLSANLTTFKTNLVPSIDANLGTSGIRLSEMTVGRSVDGGPIGTLYDVPFVP